GRRQPERPIAGRLRGLPTPPTGHPDAVPGADREDPVVAAVAPQAPAASRPASRHKADRSGPLRRIAAQGTPRTIQALIILLMLLSFGWGGLGAWTVAQHSGAAGSLAHADGPSSYAAQQLYLNLANADVTITTSLLSQAQPGPAGTQSASTLAARQHFE